MTEIKLSNSNLDISGDLNSVDNIGEVLNDIVDDILRPYVEDIDNYMEFIRKLLHDPINPPSDQELDDFTLNIPSLLYFTSQGQEIIGLKEDISKSIRTEAFNNSYTENEGTVGDKKAAAELEAKEKELVQIAYQRAYKKIKLRMEYANEMLQSVKKVTSRRISELEMSRIGGK